MERRSTQRAFGNVTITSTKGGAAHINGYGAVFYDGTPRTEYEYEPGEVERILPGAFKRAAREDDVRLLFNHHVSEVFARTVNGTLSLREDSHGLAYTAIANPNDPAALSLVARLQRGDVSGSSFSFSIEPDGQRVRLERRGGRLYLVREILAVTLYDVGPVTYPAYTATTASVKIIGEDRSSSIAGQRKAKGLELLFGIGDGPPTHVTVRGQNLLSRPGGLRRLVNEGQLTDTEARLARCELILLGQDHLATYNAN